MLDIDQKCAIIIFSKVVVFTQQNHKLCFVFVFFNFFRHFSYNYNTNYYEYQKENNMKHNFETTTDERTFVFYNNDGRGPGRLCHYFNPCPKWYDKCHKDDSNEMKTLTENWCRFCEKYKVKKVFNDIPFLRIIGSRCYHLEEHLREILCGLVDHRMSIMTEDGRYLLIGSNYTGNSELESRYDKDSYCLGEYKGFEYVLKRTILGPEYSFYNVSPSNNCLTFVWECFKRPAENFENCVNDM